MWGGDENMSADDWMAGSGIGIRELVYGLLTVAKAYEADTEDEDAAVKMMMIDGMHFLEETEPD